MRSFTWQIANQPRRYIRSTTDRPTGGLNSSPTKCWKRSVMLIGVWPAVKTKPFSGQR